MATERTMSTTWHGTLMDGARHDPRGRQRRVRRRSTSAGPHGPRSRTARRAPRSSSRPRTRPASRWRSRTGSPRPARPAERLDTSATVTFVPGEGITKVALSRARHRARPRRGGVRRGGRGREGGLPRLEGARRPCRRSRWTPRSPDALASARRTVELPRLHTSPRVGSSAGACHRPSSPWPGSNHSSRSSSARTPTCRRGCPTLPSTTTTARRPTWGGG